MASSGSDIRSRRGSFKEKLTATNILAVIIFVFLAVVPLFMSPFRVNMFGKYMCFALVALGIDMIWGYTGILSYLKLIMKDESIKRIYLGKYSHKTRIKIEKLIINNRDILVLKDANTFVKFKKTGVL